MCVEDMEMECAIRVRDVNNRKLPQLAAEPVLSQSLYRCDATDTTSLNSRTVRRRERGSREE